MLAIVSKGNASSDSVLQIPPGAKFQLAEYVPSGAAAIQGRRRLLELPQPTVVSYNQVSVTLPSIGGYYYLTGGEAPLVTGAGERP